MYPKPTNAVNTDYPTNVGIAIDGINRRLKGNLLDNGAFQIWQRGTSIAATASAVITADRWVLWRSASATGATLSQQTGGNAPFCARLQRDNSNASTATVNLGQALESANSIPYRSRNLVFAFRARMGANFSAAGATLNASLVSGTGTDQPLSAGFTGQATVASSAVVLTSSFQDFVLTASAPGASITQLGALFSFTPVGTAGAADYVEIEEAQLVVGDYAGNFPYRPTAEELQICRRQFQFGQGVGVSVSTTAVNLQYSFGVPMRAAPTASLSATATIFDPLVGQATQSAASVSATLTASASSYVATLPNFSGLTSGHVVMQTPASSTAFSAELL